MVLVEPPATAITVIASWLRWFPSQADGSPSLSARWIRSTMPAMPGCVVGNGGLVVTRMICLLTGPPVRGSGRNPAIGARRTGALLLLSREGGRRGLGGEATL
jgi:hypothetical protein